MPEDQAQKTEEASPRRKEKAREDGQIASSKEFTASLQFGAATAMLALYGAAAFEGLAGALTGLFRLAFRGEMSIPLLESAFEELLLGPMQFGWYFGGTLLVVGLVVHLAQTGFAITTKRLQPDVKRLDPMQKIKETPSENLAQATKSVVLLPLAAGAFYWIVSSDIDLFLSLPRLALAAGGVTVYEAILELLLQATLLLIALGVFDFWRQRRKLAKKLRMSKQEQRQEHKDVEGDPLIKGRLRRLQRDFMRKRMMADVPGATMVVTNPTHYAVAIQYDPETSPAPMVVAKGLDYLALRIRGIAEENGVPIVENPPLAQALYKSAEVGQEIPLELYRAVAEILAYIYRLRGERPV